MFAPVDRPKAGTKKVQVLKRGEIVLIQRGGLVGFEF
jgi:hypothetical protein